MYKCIPSSAYVSISSKYSLNSSYYLLDVRYVFPVTPVPTCVTFPETFLNSPLIEKRKHVLLTQ